MRTRAKMKMMTKRWQMIDGHLACKPEILRGGISSKMAYHLNEVKCTTSTWLTTCGGRSCLVPALTCLPQYQQPVQVLQSQRHLFLFTSTSTQHQHNINLYILLPTTHASFYSYIFNSLITSTPSVFSATQGSYQRSRSQQASPQRVLTMLNRPRQANTMSDELVPTLHYWQRNANPITLSTTQHTLPITSVLARVLTGTHPDKALASCPFEPKHPKIMRGWHSQSLSDELPTFCLACHRT